ncbi:MAG: alanine racemase [Candidatus Thorarchaeota archaeon]|jgi:D-serine deaminase-like pyridoxal phosphate-dependent protein
MRISDLMTPATLVDYDRLKANIRFMAARARDNGVSLRPHIKTHKCLEIAELQKNFGAAGIAASTIGEAQFFAKNGIKDITLAVPLAQDKIPTIKQLSVRADLNILVDHSATVSQLISALKGTKTELDVLVKVDCAYGRSGVDPDKRSSLRLVERISKARRLRFAGLLTHGGHSYSATSEEGIIKAADEESGAVLRFAESLRKENPNLAPETISVGSTPTMMVRDTIPDGITEIRPGNYVFFDYTQVALGTCRAYNCALTVLASVIGSFKNRVIVDAGATALSMDAGPTHINPDCGYGRVFSNYEEGDFAKNTTIASLSQEHGKVTLGSDSSFKKSKPGLRLRILPNHSCLTANLTDEFYVTSGDEVIDIWNVYRSRSVT